MPQKNPFSPEAPSLEAVRLKIAELLADKMDIAQDRTLVDLPFKELHADFDSLSMLEMQLLLEEAYGFEFEFDHHKLAAAQNGADLAYDKGGLPATASELALELIRQHQNHAQRLAMTKTQSVNI